MIIERKFSFIRSCCGRLKVGRGGENDSFMIDLLNIEKYLYCRGKLKSSILTKYLAMFLTFSEKWCSYTLSDKRRKIEPLEIVAIARPYRVQKLISIQGFIIAA